MPASRFESRTAIAQYFGGTTQQSVVDGNGPFITGPLQANGVSAVYPRWPKNIPDSNYFLFSQPSRGQGAIIVVHLPMLEERRIALRANNGVSLSAGTKQDNMMVELHIYHLSQHSYTEEAVADLETILDAIIDRIELDVTLGGAVVQAGEDHFGIHAEMNAPVVQEKLSRTEQYAKISFQVQLFWKA